VETVVSDPVGTLEAADLAGISYRQIGYWISCGHIRADSNGSGTRTHLPATELEVLLRMGRLTRTGLAVKTAAKAARFMTEKDCRYAPLPGGVVIWIREGP
jgi:DNA-binding transcriptional MerR regulator